MNGRLYTVTFLTATVSQVSSGNVLTRICLVRLSVCLRNNFIKLCADFREILCNRQVVDQKRLFKFWT